MYEHECILLASDAAKSVRSFAAVPLVLSLTRLHRTTKTYAQIVVLVRFYQLAGIRFCPFTEVDSELKGAREMQIWPREQ